MNDDLCFSADGGEFEKSGISNGGRYWLEREYAAMLGYESDQAFSNVINKAIGVCMTLKIPIAENFIQAPDAAGTLSYKLSRFACYLVAMNADSRKPGVAMAQVYLASLAEAAHQFIRSAEDVERVQIRDDVSERERTLSGVAKAAGVVEYGFFQNAGYRGMYNMDLNALKKRKGLRDKKRSLLDFMDKRELAGNLFRITETQARLENEATKGQKAAESVAFSVGQDVRGLMLKNTGTSPENLRLAGDIRDVQKNLKSTHKDMKQLDGKKPRKAMPAPKDEGSGGS